MTYQVCLADPPWEYNNRVQHGPAETRPKFGGGAGQHYDMMTDQDIIDMGAQVAPLMDENAVLFMWATMPKLPLAFEVIKAWGFRYATNAFTWIKMTKGGKPHTRPGFYTASNAEICLLGVRGSMPPDRKLINSVILAQPREHSRKPEEVRERIETMYPNAKRMELFCRHTRPGWATFGNEVNGGMDIRDALALEMLL